MGEQGTLFDLGLAERAKERGQLLAASSDRAWDWKRQALQTIHDLAKTGHPFTADEVVELIGLPGSGPGRSNAVGATFSAAAKRGWIVHTGSYRKSRRALSHARVVAVWVGAEGVE